MDWARILAFVTGMLDQELLARIEYLAAENHILKARVEGAAEALGRRASHARRDRSSIGPQGSRRGGQCRPAGHHPGLVPQPRCPQIRWLESSSKLRQASDQARN